MENTTKSRVLVADPEEVSRFGLVHLLKSQPRLAVCGEAETLSAVRDLAAKLKPDLLIYDPAMGDSGAFLKELALQWSKETRAVAFTNRCDALSVQRALRSGIFGYVSRRDPATALIRAVLGASSGERHIGPLVQRMLLEGLACGTMEVSGSEVSCLSDRELQVYHLLGQGLGTRAVAQELSVSIKTVETHRQRIREKLHLPSGHELQRRAVLFHDAHTSASSDS